MEKYTRVLGSTSREYLVQRIKDLAEGEYMSAFRWNGGGRWKDKDWTPEFPTDSQVSADHYNLDCLEIICQIQRTYFLDCDAFI
jgi:hypothetical protein